MAEERTEGGLIIPSGLLCPVCRESLSKHTIERVTVDISKKGFKSRKRVQICPKVLFSARRYQYLHPKLSLADALAVILYEKGLPGP